MAEDWSDEELEAAVSAYIDMRDKVRRGEPVVKRQYFADLAAQHNRRTAKSFEYRMQNISHVYELLGRPWVSGLRPARNVGRRTAERIQRIIERIEDQAAIDDAGFAEQVERARGDRDRPAPAGDNAPARQQSTVTVYDRSAEVVAWVLDRADGYCESCETAAPFVTGAGRPYLEVHHLRRLADGGPDTVDNAVALCPNCHRALHYSGDAEANKDELIGRVGRLVAH